MPKDVVKVVSKCQKCGKVDEFLVPASGIRLRSKGVLIKDAFPDLPAHRLVQLAEHVCPTCQGVIA